LTQPEALSVAVVGAGVFGRHHARVYDELRRMGEKVRVAAVVDLDRARASALASDFGAQAFSTVSEMLTGTKVQAASVVVPTVHHLGVASGLMQAGVDVLVEKPVATKLEEADELIRLAKSSGRIAQVGHLERFNPAVRATIPLITRPMFFEVHRLSMFSPRALDVDVVLDLMIHDLDIVLSFVDSPVKEIRAVGLPILSGKVDIANVRMEFESGCVANFTASRVSTERVRKLRFFQPKQYVSVDYSRQDVLVFTVDMASTAPAPEVRTGVFSTDELKSAVGRGGPLPSQIQMTKPAVTQEEPLMAELRSFLRAVRERSRPVVTLEEGRTALGVALEILKSIGEHNRHAKLGSPAGAG